MTTINPIRTARVRTRTNAAADTPSTTVTLPHDLALKVVYRITASLRPSAHNPRTHSKKQIHKIVASLRHFGFVNPVLVNGEGEIIAGQGRLEAATILGLKEVPTICLDHLTEADTRALRIADNKIAELAGWDEEILKVELGYLNDIHIDLPEIAGFETAEIDIILFDEPAAQSEPADEVPDVQDGPAVSRPGDLWLVGEGRILNGNSLESYCEALLAGELAQMVFTDPPYNVAIAKIMGAGKARYREFAMASGEMSKREFIAFLTTALTRMHECCVDGALVYTCMDWAHLHELLEAGHAVFDELKNIITWAKTNAGQGAQYRSQVEYIPLWKKGTAPHINNIQMGRHGNYRSNLWQYPGMNTFKRGREEDLASHPTVKNVHMIMDAIKDATRPGDIVLDPFGGSGTTLIAAHKTKRRGFLVELDPLYVDVAIRRCEKALKLEARHAVTGLTFAEMQALRQAEGPAASSDPVTSATEEDSHAA